MASAWVKSLQCRSRAYDDVFSPTPKHLIPSTSCRKSAQTLKDVVDVYTTTKKPRSSSHKPHYWQKKQPNNSHVSTDNTEPYNKPKTTKESASALAPSRTSRSSPPDQLLTELPPGHPSRNVVEIIFHTSWTHSSLTARVDMIFKLQNASRTLARFEEYREAVKSRAGFSDGRCVADGNEMMRFHCLGPAGGVHDTRGGAWGFIGGKGSAICTYSGSGRAHESAGGGRGRRAMLVCRVIAGRVSKPVELESLLEGLVGFDSVSGENGELLVFDPRAVLPCFLIIYKL